MEQEPRHSYINYLYFGGFFAMLVFLVAGSIFTKAHLTDSQFFFFLYALGQITLEVALFVFLGLMLRKHLGRLSFALFIGMTFFALIFHVLDFMMVRVLDLSIWESLKIFVFYESWDNFLYLLDASGVPIWTWILLFVGFAFVPLMGICIYKISEHYSTKKPLTLKHSYFLQVFICIPAALIYWDYSASKMIHPNAYSEFIKSLPWKFTFLRPENIVFTLPESLHPFKKESDVKQAIAQNETVLTKKPNIYLFVIESLREDFITPEIAPHLSRFKNDSTHFDRAVSNGNGTHISWFSAFHSQFPYFWKTMQQKWRSGSPALQLLKKWGYEIRLYTSAQLGYYGMERLLFGDDLHILDERQTFHHAPPSLPADTDALAINKLKDDVVNNPKLQEGQIFIVFLDSTHFNYSWPKDWDLKFKPVAREWNFFQAFQSSKNVELIKNSYRNSVNYVDSLFGHFYNNLPKKEEAVVIVMGDHGEEFFEQGHLFHNSHLTVEQVHIPLYFKFGKGERQPQKQSLISQMDIFPSLIDYLSGQTVDFLAGNSIFQEKKWPFAITARFNAGLTPYEFCIHNGTNKLTAQFDSKHDIFHSKALRILSLKNFRDESILDCKNCIEQWVRAEFDPALKRIFAPVGLEDR